MARLRIVVIVDALLVVVLVSKIYLRDESLYFDCVKDVFGYLYARSSNINSSIGLSLF